MRVDRATECFDMGLFDLAGDGADLRKRSYNALNSVAAKVTSSPATSKRWPVYPAAYNVAAVGADQRCVARQLRPAPFE